MERLPNLISGIGPSRYCYLIPRCEPQAACDCPPLIVELEGQPAREMRAYWLRTGRTATR